MKKKLKSLLLVLIICTIAFGIYFNFESDKKIVFRAVVGLLAFIVFEDAIGHLISIVTSLFQRSNWKTSQRNLEKLGALQDDTVIRISFAYLFRIKIGDKYFLVQNTRTKKYQPVGGAYKFYEEEANYLSKNIPAENDDCIPVDRITKRDYRLLVKNKDLKAFIKRFDRTSFREKIDNLSREFIEELFSSGILIQSDFGNLTYKYVGRHMTNIHKTLFKPFEILLADILEVRLTDKQEELFSNLMNKQSPKYIFVTSDEIKAEGVDTLNQKYVDYIANHTSKILIENTDKLILRNKYKEAITISL